MAPNDAAINSSVFQTKSSSTTTTGENRRALPSQTAATTSSSSKKHQQQNIINHFWCLAAIVCGLMMLCLLSAIAEAAPPRYSAGNAEALENFVSHIDADPEAYANIKRSASPFFAWGGKRAAAPAQQAFFHWGGKRAAKPAANPAAAANYYDLWNYYRTYMPFVMEESSKRAAAPRAAQFFSWGG